MTITALFQPQASAQLSLDSFRDSASEGETLHVVHDGSAWKVWACSTAATQRFGPRPGLEMDTTAIFVAALERAFSPGIREAVVRELGLELRSGQPLKSSVALQAIAMAETSRRALEGVDFMTRLMCSAVTQSAGFVDACLALGLLPEAVSAQQRQSIDACMRERFIQAAYQGQSPVAPGLAQQWLHAELLALQGPAADPR